MPSIILRLRQRLRAARERATVKAVPHIGKRPVSPHGRDMAALERLKHDLYWHQFDKPTVQRRAEGGAWTPGDAEYVARRNGA